MIPKLVCTAALLAALPLSAPAATLDYFLKIDGVTGASMDDKHKNWIDVLSWSWGASNTGTGTSFAPFSWEQGLDSSFVPLFLGLVNDTRFSQAQLSVVRLDGSRQEFFRMTLNGARVLGLSSDGSADSIQVHAAMSYEALAMRYCPQKPDGSLGVCVEGSFTLNSNRLSFSGDPNVLMGLAEAGGSLNFINQVPEPASWATLAAGLAVVGVLARRRRPAAADCPAA